MTPSLSFPISVMVARCLAIKGMSLPQGWVKEHGEIIASPRNFSGPAWLLFLPLMKTSFLLTGLAALLLSTPFLRAEESAADQREAKMLSFLHAEERNKY